jgi:hypothetical protein
MSNPDLPGLQAERMQLRTELRRINRRRRRLVARRTSGDATPAADTEMPAVSVTCHENGTVIKLLAN